MDTVVGLFDNYSDADQVIKSLHEYGVDDNRISVVTRGNQKIEHGHVTAGEGAVTGAATGGVVGLLAGLSALLVPGIGPVIASGAFASALATTVGMTAVGVGVGAAAGGITGALIKAGVSHEDAELYAEGVKRGGVLVSVETDREDQDEISDILRSAGAVDMEARRESWEDEGWSKFDPAERTKDEISQR
jgi:uncharacterized membrane protein